MGCDIHFFVERQNDDGVWEHVGDDRVIDFNTDWQNAPFYIGRNYRLFAILANVRNYHGGIEPIAEPRGLPEGLSKEVDEYFFMTTMDNDEYEALQKKVEDGEVEEEETYRFCSVSSGRKWSGNENLKAGDRVDNPDLHSMSHFTLAELLTHNWNQEMSQTGIVDVNQYARYKKEGKPSSWYGMVSCPSIKHISNEEMDRLLESGEVVPDNDANPYSYHKSGYHTQLTWTEKQGETVQVFTDKIIPNLQKLHKDPTKVRIVFGFDN